MGTRLSVEHLYGVLVEQEVEPQVLLQLRVRPGLLERLRPLLPEAHVYVLPALVLEVALPVHLGHAEGLVEKRQGRVPVLQYPDRRVAV